MEAERKPDGIVATISDQLLRTLEQTDIALIAGGLGLDPVGADMGRITGLSPAALSRAAHGQGRPRQWRRLATLAATVHEIVLLTGRVVGDRSLEPDSIKRWLYAGSLVLDGRIMLPIEALSDERLCQELLLVLRTANAAGSPLDPVDGEVAP